MTKTRDFERAIGLPAIDRDKSISRLHQDDSR